ncbi:MAG: amino acid adenylation domain-containing protein, partial [Bacteroidota bacterium]
GELNDRANQLAHHLRGLGVGREALVGIHMHRCLDMIVGLLAILKAGGAYVPLDPTYPKKRLAFMLEDSKATVLLTVGRLAGKLPEHQAKVVCLDREWECISHQPNENPDSGVKDNNLAYVIYTSGSTGRPKGVMVEHRNVINFFVGMDADIDHVPSGTWLALTSISFDISVLELFWTLARGFKVVLFDFASVMSSPNVLNIVKEESNPSVISSRTFPALIRRHHVTHLQCTPSLVRMLISDPESFKSLRSLKKLILGGESLPPSLVEQLSTVVSGEIYNMYGPTETTVWSTTYRIDKSEKADNSVSIGRPIANTELYILDRNLQPVPVGVPGELFIGGQGVVRGYLNRPELTNERFVPNPFKNGPNGSLYRTGDLVRYMVDGKIEFLGRLDHQVKIRGYRIELGEIEAALEQHPAVREAVVIAREDIPGDKRLVAYLTTKSESAPIINELRNFLKEKLPDFMVPSAFVFLEELPLTPNGKVNRRALPTPEAVRLKPKKDYVAPRSFTEQSLAKLWTEVLGMEEIGLRDNFFDLGGNSLSAVQITNRICQTFDVELPLQMFVGAPTLAGLAQKVDIARVERTLKQLSFPTRLAVEVCADCNLACAMCHHPQMRRPKGRMPFELWKRCADQIADVSPSTQCWFSFCGEPLLEPDLLLRMIGYGKSVGLRSLNINTNGMLLTPDLAEPILDSGVDLVVFGIDGFSKETYERIRIGGERDELYANVEHFLAARHARRAGPEVQVQFIEMDENEHELEEFKAYWLERGAVVKARRKLSWGGKFETSLCVPVEERIP